jgi:hypothetical protein
VGSAVLIFESLCLAAALSCSLLRAQNAEPILTQTAIPFTAKAGSLKLDYAGGITPANSSQVIPEAILEVGAGYGWEILARFPLIRIPSGPQGAGVIGGGQLAAGARYLLAGGADRSYAISVQEITEAPTGDTRLVGNSTQVIPGLLANWRPAGQFVIHSNLSFDRSIGGTGPRSSFLEYSGAVVWLAGRHVAAVFEFAASTNTFTGKTQAVAQPEVIRRAGKHLELKAGLPVAPRRASIGLRGQLSWLWGKPP